MVALEPRPYLLANRVQHYAWGSRGPDAFIPRLLGIKDQDRPYAELWMGTHPNAPSDVVVDGARVPLPQLVSRYPLEILGEAVCARFGGAFPFLFKVLSAAEALSIQVHPDKAQARRLHAQDPEHYADDNHKPEIAVALDSLTALVGFKGLDEIAQALERYPELAGFVGQEVVGQLRGAARAPRDLLRLVYATLMRRSLTHPGPLAASIAQLRQRLRRSDVPLSKEEQIFLDVGKKYAGDVGLYSIFLLNRVHLERGQGLFTGPGVPHAYLKGNIVECMATSDNVVRAGLTPKYKDVETLVDLLTYETGPVPILEGETQGDKVVYRAPVAEFQVSRWQVKPGREKVRGNTPGILLVTQGQVRVRWGAGSKGGEMALQRGQSALVPAFLDEFELVCSDHAVLFQARVPPLNDV